MAVGTPTFKSIQGGRAPQFPRPSQSPRYIPPPRAPMRTPAPRPAEKPATPKLPKGRRQAAQKAVQRMLQTGFAVSPYLAAAVYSGAFTLSMRERHKTLAEVSGIDFDNWNNPMIPGSPSYDPHTDNKNPLYAAHTESSVNITPRWFYDKVIRFFTDVVPLPDGNYHHYYEYTVRIPAYTVPYPPGSAHVIPDPAMAPRKNPFIETAPQVWPHPQPRPARSPRQTPRPRYRRLPSRGLAPRALAVDLTSNTVRIRQDTATRPPRGVRERKHRSALLQVMAGLLDVLSESVEVFEIVADAAGVDRFNPDGSRRDYTEVFMDVLETPVSDVDWSDLALGLAYNHFEDKVAGRAANALQGKMKNLGLTTYQIP